jgi:hypothetical protein
LEQFSVRRSSRRNGGGSGNLKKIKIQLKDKKFLLKGKKFNKKLGKGERFFVSTQVSCVQVFA